MMNIKKQTHTLKCLGLPIGKEMEDAFQEEESGEI